MSVKTGVLPGGVLEAGVALAAALEELLELDPVALGSDRAVQRAERGAGRQHATELVQRVRPVEARLHQLGDGLGALIGHRDEVGVRRQSPGASLDRARLGFDRATSPFWLEMLW